MPVPPSVRALPPAVAPLRRLAALALLLVLALAGALAPAPARAGDDVVRIHYHREGNDYAGWGLHLWGVGLNLPPNLTWAHPMDPRGVDAFGIWWDVPVEPQVAGFNFIIHQGEAKSASHDLAVDVVRHGREVWLLDGDDVIYAKPPPIRHAFTLGEQTEARQRRTLAWVGVACVAGAVLVVLAWRLARRRLAATREELAAHARLLLQAQEQIKAQGERLQLGATADELTGLPTRGGLHQALEQALARSARDGTQVALLFVDLDGFKAVNDSAGHDAGDEVLRTIAARLKSALRDGDLVARVGGDEFVVLLESASSPLQAWKVGARLVRSAAQPIDAAGATHRVGASVGLAVYPGDGADGPALLKAADAAMYEVKRAGRNACRFVDPRRQRELEQQLQAQSRLETALERGELTLVTTPVVELSTGRVTGLQAAAHWSDDGRLMDAAPVLERADDPSLAARVDRWLVTAACRAAARAHVAPGERAPHVAAAIAATFADAETLPALVRDLLAEEGLPPQRLMLMFPARVLADAGRSLEVIVRLRAQGVRIGFTGAADVELGLQRLTEAPVDLLQVEAGSAALARLGTAYMRALAAVGAQCGFATAASGIATPAQRRWAEAAGCSLGIGPAASAVEPVHETAPLDA